MVENPDAVVRCWDLRPDCQLRELCGECQAESLRRLIGIVLAAMHESGDLSAFGRRRLTAAIDEGFTGVIGVLRDVRAERLYVAPSAN